MALPLIPVRQNVSRHHSYASGTKGRLRPKAPPTVTDLLKRETEKKASLTIYYTSQQRIEMP